MEATLEILAKQLGAILKKRNLMVTTAESCTGGGLSYWLTSVPGSTAWFDRGFVTYSNNAKIDLLAVDPEILKTFGAVSEETAREMALGALEHSKADLSIAITGIAGPEGGSAEKPVGMIWVAWAQKDDEIKTECFQFEGDRKSIRDQSIKIAIENLVEWLVLK